MAAKYDPDILQAYADDLYARAKSIIASTALVYGLVAFLVTFVIVEAMPRFVSPDYALLIMAIPTLLGILAGVEAGRKKAFALKLQAQQILCQQQIELNTRQVQLSLLRVGTELCNRERAGRLNPAHSVHQAFRRLTRCGRADRAGCLSNCSNAISA